MTREELEKNIKKEIKEMCKKNKNIIKNEIFLCSIFELVVHRGSVTERQATCFKKLIFEKKEIEEIEKELGIKKPTIIMHYKIAKRKILRTISHCVLKLKIYKQIFKTT